MAKSNGDSAARQRAFAARIQRIEQRQEQYEKDMEECQLQLNRLVDGKDRSVRVFNAQIAEIVKQSQQINLGIIEIIELQAKAELRLDRHDERFADSEETYTKRLADSEETYTKRLAGVDKAHAKRLADMDKVHAKRLADSEEASRRRFALLEEKHLEFEESMKKLADEQAEATRKLNALLELESWRNSSNGQGDRKKKRQD